MSSGEDLPPLDPELTSLFAEERARPEPAADAAKARVLSRLEASTAAAPALAAKLGPLLVALAVGGAIGAVVTAKVQEPKIVYVDRPVASAPAIAESVALPAITRVEAPSPSASSAPAPVATPTIDTLARERALLDEARASLAKGDAKTALAATDRHEKEFPRGQMVEEREALAIQALAKLGRSADARDRAAAFKTHYPNSVLAPVVDSVTNPAAEPK